MNVETGNHLKNGAELKSQTSKSTKTLKHYEMVC